MNNGAEGKTLNPKKIIIETQNVGVELVEEELNRRRCFHNDNKNNVVPPKIFFYEIVRMGSVSLTTKTKTPPKLWDSKRPPKFHKKALVKN